MSAKQSTVKTRSEVTCPLFGPPSDLNVRLLPTISDTIKYILIVRHRLQDLNSGKQPSITHVFACVSCDIEKIWASASIPTVSPKRIKELLKKYYDEYLKIIRYPKSKISDNYRDKLTSFKNGCLTQLFDIAACKCTIVLSTDYCSCAKQNKVPVIEQKFLLDQRSHRQMIIAGVDKIQTIKNCSKIERQHKLQNRMMDFYNSQPGLSSNRKIARTSLTLNTDSNAIMTTPPVISLPMTDTPYNTLRLPELAKTCDRYGISNRSGAAIATAVLQDVGLISHDDKNLVVDKNKLWRARNNERCNLQENMSHDQLEAIYFDGRKDKTLLIENSNGRSYRRLTVEEHISLISEPGSVYLGHTTPRTGTGKEICNSIIEYCQSHKIDLNELKCIGCDGTATNTGWKAGVIRLTELKLQKPLQWFVCQLHANELPLRHLFCQLDGGTSGPREYSGLIGKALETCDKLRVKKYAAINSGITDIDQNVLKSFSTDQKYLYEMCRAVSTGTCSAELANRQPGKMAHSRWLTTANRILRYYIGCQKPSNKLKILTEYIVKVYAPVCFEIKKKSSCIYGAHHVFDLIRLTRSFDNNVRSIIDPVIQRNAFFAHPENILVAMISDERKSVRELALRKILQARRQPISGSVRVFKLPQLNFNATDYIDMIIWAECQVTPPPIMSHVSEEDLQKMIDDISLARDVVFSKFPCHTQTVERCIKLVTEASITVASKNARDGLIRTKLKSRSVMPSFDNKAQYNC